MDIRKVKKTKKNKVWILIHKKLALKVEIAFYFYTKSNVFLLFTLYFFSTVLWCTSQAGFLKIFLKILNHNVNERFSAKLNCDLLQQVCDWPRTVTALSLTNPPPELLCRVLTDRKELESRHNNPLIRGQEVTEEGLDAAVHSFLSRSGCLCTNLAAEFIHSFIYQ